MSKHHPRVRKEALAARGTPMEEVMEVREVAEATEADTMVVAESKEEASAEMMAAAAVAVAGCGRPWLLMCNLPRCP